MLVGSPSRGNANRRNHGRTQELADARARLVSQSALIYRSTGFLKTAAYIYAVASRQGPACSLLSSGSRCLLIVGYKPFDCWSRRHREVLNSSPLIGVYTSNRPYLQKVHHDAAGCDRDYILGRLMIAMLLAAYPNRISRSLVDLSACPLPQFEWVGQLNLKHRSRNGSEVLMLAA